MILCVLENDCEKHAATTMTLSKLLSSAELSHCIHQAPESVQPLSQAVANPLAGENDDQCYNSLISHHL